jgi:arylsulfatase A-like enzyme
MNKGAKSQPNSPNDNLTVHETTKPQWVIPTGVLWFFAGHQLWAMCLQLQHFTFSVHPYWSSPSLPTWFFCRFPFLQGENLLVSFALGLLVWPALRSRLGRLAVGSFFLAVNGVLLLNQISYRLTGNHLRISFSEEGPFRPRLLLDSLIPGMDALWLGNLAAFFLLHLVLFAVVFRHPHSGVSLISSGKTRWLLVHSLVFLGLGFAFPSTNQGFYLERHPLLALLEEWQGRREISSAPFVNVPDFQRPREPWVEPEQEREELFARCETIRRLSPAPHVFIIVMESVGARQLLRERQPDPQLTPNLLRLCQSGILFDAVYTAFPATARAHVPVVSGGDPFLDSIILARDAPAIPEPNLLSEFRKKGYRSALFASSDLNFGNLDMLLHGLKFDHFFHFGVADTAFQEAYPLNSWGGSEDGALSKLDEWLAANHAASGSLFVKFLPNATHHPYSAPAHFSSPFGGATDEQKYRHSLHYLDWCIGNILKMLEKYDLYKNSLIVVFGDHGEAFGTSHPGNFLHQSFLYEENVRSYLLFSSPHLAGSPFVSNRAGSLGDLLPTLASLANVPLSEVKGRNLVSFRDEPRINFFYKLSFPPKWGCRDGKWKFIGNMYLPIEPELFDLETDSGEERNLAQMHPERAELYGTLCRSWFRRSSAELMTYMDPIPSFTQVIWPEEAVSWATDTVVMGAVNASGCFRPEERFHPYQRVYAAIRFGASAPANLQADWISPVGQHFTDHLKTGSGPLQILTSFSGGLPMTDGQWELLFRDGSGIAFNRSFITDFSVSSRHE